MSALPTRSASGSWWRLALAFVAAALTAFAGVAVAAADGTTRLDAVAHRVLFDALGASGPLGAAVTWFGNNATLTTGVVLVALALVLSRHYGEALRVVFASGLGGLVVRGLKLLFSRDRPLDPIIPAAGYSFPSGHAFASTVFYGMMVYLVFRLTERQWARALAAVVGPLIILAVGLSRVYLNVHYPTDVIGGWLAGSAWLVTSLLLIAAVETRTRGHRAAARPADASSPSHEIKA